MPHQPEVNKVGEDTIKVSGCLDVTSVAGYRDAVIGLMDEVSEPVIDLSDATVVGSAVIALLIAWQRHAAKGDKPLRFTDPPANLVDIARACGVEDFIALSGEDASA